MKKIKNSFIEIIKKPIYYIPLIVTILLSFMYLLTHSTVNIDTLSYERYYSGIELIQQGRFVAPLIDRIFHIYKFNPFFIDFVSILILSFSSVVICAFIKEITKSKINILAYTIFSCLFISYPLLPEIFTYTPMGLSIALGYFLTILSVILTYQGLQNRKKSIIVISVLPLIAAVSLYESFASVYIVYIFIYLLLESIYNNKKFKEVFLIGFKYSIIILAAVFLNLIISKLILLVFGLEKSMNAAKYIYYVLYGLGYGIKNLISTCLNNYIFAGIYYFPIKVLVISLIITLVTMIYRALKTKTSSTLIIYIGLIIAVFSLSIIEGNAAPYRTCQTFSIFIAFTFMILVDWILKQKKNGFLKKSIITLTFILIFYQCQDMHYWFYVNDLRYQEEKNVLTDVAQRIMSKYGTDKPIVLTGYYELSENTKSLMYLDKESFKYKLYTSIAQYGKLKNSNVNIKIGETNVNSYLAWAVYAFGENGAEVNKLWKMYGYNFKMGTADMLEEAIKYKGPKYPSKGCIYETDQFIMVNF